MAMSGFLAKAITGDLSPVIDCSFELRNAQLALNNLGKGGRFGKTILQTGRPA